MIIMSLRDGDLPSKQSPVSRGGCFARYARNDMSVNALREPHKGVILRSTGGEELRPFVGPLRALMASILDKAFKEELQG